MALVSSHTLNGVDGTHAGGIPVRLIHLTTGNVLVETSTDAGGRLSLPVDLAAFDQNDRYELVFLPKDYWESRGMKPDHLMDEIVLRFTMPDPEARYHMPIILSPHGYSMWQSVPEQMDG